MKDMTKIKNKLMDELSKIGDGNITTQNLESAMKLATTLEKIMKSEHYEMEMNDGYSERRGRDRRTGRYVSRDGGNSYRGYAENGDSYGMDENYDRYMDSKSSYRYSRSGNDKQQMLSDLSEMMEGLTDKLENMCRDTDCSEEIDMIQRYMNRLKNVK